MAGIEQVEFGLRMQRVPAAERRRRVDELLELVGLDGFGSRSVTSLSGGEAKRIALARSLAPAPPLLLLDEPLTGLDEPSGRDLLRRLKEWAAGGRLAIAVIHDLATVRAWCDHVLLLNRELIATGPTAETMSEANVGRCYGEGPVVRSSGRPLVAHEGHSHV